MFLHDLKQLLKQAIPEADAGTRNQLLLHQFINGLPGHISKQLRVTGEVNNLDRLMERAKLLITIDEPQRAAAIQMTEIKELKEQISVLTEQMAALSIRHRQPATVVCYRCQRPGHTQRDCPVAKKCYSCGSSGETVSQEMAEGCLRRGRDTPETNKPHECCYCGGGCPEIQCSHHTWNGGKDGSRHNAGFWVLGLLCVATDFLVEKTPSPVGLTLVSAAGEDIPVLGCITVPLGIRSLQVSHSL